MFLRQGVSVSDGDTVTVVFSDNGMPKNVYVKNGVLAAKLLMQRAKVAQVDAEHQAAVTVAEAEHAQESAKLLEVYESGVRALTEKRDAVIAALKEERKAAFDSFDADTEKLHEEAYKAGEVQMVKEARAATT